MSIYRYTHTEKRGSAELSSTSADVLLWYVFVDAYVLVITQRRSKIYIYIHMLSQCIHLCKIDERNVYRERRGWGYLWTPSAVAMYTVIEYICMHRYIDIRIEKEGLYVHFNTQHCNDEYIFNTCIHRYIHVCIERESVVRTYQPPAPRWCPISCLATAPSAGSFLRHFVCTKTLIQSCSCSQAVRMMSCYSEGGGGGLWFEGDVLDLP